MTTSHDPFALNGAPSKRKAWGIGSDSSKWADLSRGATVNLGFRDTAILGELLNVMASQKLVENAYSASAIIRYAIRKFIWENADIIEKAIESPTPLAEVSQESRGMFRQAAEESHQQICQQFILDLNRCVDYPDETADILSEMMRYMNGCKLQRHKDDVQKIMSTGWLES